MTYHREGLRKIVIDHTAVSKSLKGKGVGKALVDAAVKYARGKIFTQTRLPVRQKSSRIFRIIRRRFDQINARRAANFRFELFKHRAADLVVSLRRKSRQIRADFR